MENPPKKRSIADKFRKMSSGNNVGDLDLDAEHDAAMADRMKRLGISLP
ncbi:hypothetical protein JW721_02990 [Candidatus Micrarchaeota archaeon]|nr:hypothetical protein [Candidatus Micrarchaeota archaeon]